MAVHFYLYRPPTLQMSLVFLCCKFAGADVFIYAWQYLDYNEHNLSSNKSLKIEGTKKRRKEKGEEKGAEQPKASALIVLYGDTPPGVF